MWRDTDKTTILTCTTKEDFSSALKITKDYTKWLNIDLSFQNIEQEFADFSSIYSTDNRGIFLLALHNGILAGGVGFREFEKNIAEMKRLFVYRKYRRLHIGEKLIELLIIQARRLGYEKMRLDTLCYMKNAIGLYHKFGFEEIPPYRFNPDPTAVFMELQLKQFNKWNGEESK